MVVLKMIGLIAEEKLDTFNMPYYAPTTKEVEDVIEAEGSFTLQSREVFRNEWDSYLHIREASMDDLFRKFEEDVLDHTEKENCRFINNLVDKEGLNKKNM
ncbi:salicylate carboxymethyltransferase-like [Pyrus ussuriensis x Pyrus communis]|uniref:Salicylate carboxymethyltransferase-like n=1 Tax=Pyrus ussuriensis x Pyrus communis TaxID=2448454 RepID=A0A5N5I659_9ROSA|nr:salicylate carboxymethyltransferase-like [Pyrus ussuriensis x Pyrus communis]